MKAFVIFGDIEFWDNALCKVALVHNVLHSGFYGDDELGELADKHGGDYLVPHYYDGQITFMQYNKEEWK
jgi:hypothetical protein